MKPTSKYLVRAAAQTAVVLILYFLIMKIAGFGLNLEYRLAEFVILAIGIHLGLRNLRNHDPAHFTYLRGILSGVYIGALACFLFAFFMWAYLMFIDPNFMELLRESAPFGKYLNPYIIGTTMIAEGAGAGALFAFISMNALAGKGEEI